MISQLAMKKEIAALCRDLVDVCLQNGGKPFDGDADPVLVKKRVELLRLIKERTDNYVAAGGSVLCYTFELPTADQADSGQWSNFVSEMVTILEGAGLSSSYLEFVFNDEKALKSIFMDDIAFNHVKERMSGRVEFGKISPLRLSNDCPVFLEFGLPYLGYMNEYGLTALRLKIDLFLSK